MRKLLVCIIGLAVIAVLLEIVAPQWLAARTETILRGSGGANRAEVHIDSLPALRLLFGEIDHLHIDAEGLKVGAVYLSSASMTGEGLRIDPIDAYLYEKLTIQSAEKLEFTATMTEERLRDLLVQKLTDFDNIKVAIHPTGVEADATVKIIGRTAEVHLAGDVVEDRAGLYFHVKDLRIKGAHVGSISLDAFIDDILLFRLEDLPLKAEIRSIEQKDGQVVVIVDSKNE